MNNSKLPYLKWTNNNKYKKSSWENWEKRTRFKRPHEYGLLKAHDFYLNPKEVSYLKESAKYLKVNLPLSLDPNRHFGYNAVPDYFDYDGKNSLCCDIDGFLPEKPPFVPLILRCLINHLEDNCNNIEYLYSIVSHFGSRAKRILLILSHSQQDYYVMREIIRLEAVQNIALAVLLFLKSLCPNLLLLNKKDTMNDRQMSKNYIACLHSSCFLMIHLLHIWEYSKDPATSLLLISNIFGPILLQSKKTDAHPQECVNNFAALMMNYDYDFWYHLSKHPLKILNLYNGVTAKESKYLNYRYRQ